MTNERSGAARVPPELRDSRRLTGPNLVSPGPAAVADAKPGSIDATELIEEWTRQLGRILPALGWADHQIHSRSYHDGVTVAFGAPIDALYAATEVNEWAFDAATATWRGAPKPRLDDAVQQLTDAISKERNPALIALQQEAKKRGVCFTWDDDHASVGMGVGSLTWPVDRLPPPEGVPWSDVHDVPVVLVTGSNGKTTTVRMLAAIARAWGRRVGYSCTDGIVVDGETLDTGDWSGPGGARAVLRDPRVEVAILETARGGLLRRGLALERADAALVSNIAADHLGEWGVHAPSDIADAKLVVRRAVTNGVLVINADDSLLAQKARELDQPIQWISAGGQAAATDSAVQGQAGPAWPQWSVTDDSLVRRDSGGTTLLLRAAELPSALGGAARYNIYNALGAAALAYAMGAPDDAVTAGLTAFGTTPTDNPGRGNRFEIDGIEVLVDFAHNPHGVRAIAEWVREQRVAGNVLTMVGQAGDRDDDSIRDLAKATLEMAPDYVVIKAMPKYARGRAVAEVVGLLRETLLGAGFGAEHLTEAPTELAGVNMLLERAQPGDLVVLPVHSSRQEVLELLAARSGATR